MFPIIFVYIKSAKIMSRPDKFIEHVQETIDLIKNSVTDKDFKVENNLRLDPAKAKELSKIKLMLLELERY